LAEKLKAGVDEFVHLEKFSGDQDGDAIFKFHLWFGL
jgi:hypothetical protein